MPSALLCFGCSILVAASSPSAFNVAWSAPSKGPGTTVGGQSTFQDAMPIGNGRTTALAWANASTGGVGIYLGSQDAQDSQQDLLKLALLQLSLEPNPLDAPGAYFNQSLDLATGTFSLEMGGADHESHAVRISAWVDANTDVLRIRAAARDGTTPFSLRVVASSTRPSHTNWSTRALDCATALISPDVYVDPLPTAPIALARALPVAAAHAMRHASGAKRPLRALFDGAGATVPPFGSFASGSVLAYHRNTNDSGGMSLAQVLQSQGVGSLTNSTPDHWTDLTSGFALDASAGGPALRRVDAHTLASEAPAPAFVLRATVLAVQTDTVDDWQRDMLALLATDKQPAAETRSAHEAWWDGFWGRSHIEINATRWPAPPVPTPVPVPTPSPPPPATALPVPGATLWLRASDLQAAGAVDGSAVARWGKLAQANATCRPTFVADALGPGAPAVHFAGAHGPGAWDGSFLHNSALTLPGNGSTHFAVFRDGGSTASCCSGIVFWGGADIGISTAPVPPGGSVDDDDGAASVPSARVLVALADGPGIGSFDTLDIAGRLVQVDATYDAGGASVAVGGCIHAKQGDVPVGRAGAGMMVGSRNNELGRYFKGDIAEVIIYPRALNSSEAAAVRTYLAAQWPQMPSHKCTPSRHSDKGYQLSRMYADVRGDPVHPGNTISEHIVAYQVQRHGIYCSDGQQRRGRQQTMGARKSVRRIFAASCTSRYAHYLHPPLSCSATGGKTRGCPMVQCSRRVTMTPSKCC